MRSRLAREWCANDLISVVFTLVTAFLSLRFFRTYTTFAWCHEDAALFGIAQLHMVHHTRRPEKEYLDFFPPFLYIVMAASITQNRSHRFQWLLCLESFLFHLNISISFFFFFAYTRATYTGNGNEHTRHYRRKVHELASSLFLFDESEGQLDLLRHYALQCRKRVFLYLLSLKYLVSDIQTHRAKYTMKGTLLLRGVAVGS